mmetsp:Transcript_29355/g.44437  ORF Transcript_29355/g.44437 Transcript_29355/m.44437 type:complete len:481 (+) Transcript_29355:145-1587(+)
MKLETYFSSTRSRQPEHRCGGTKTVLTSTTDETKSILTEDALNNSTVSTGGADETANKFIPYYEKDTNPAFEETGSHRITRGIILESSNNDICNMFMVSTQQNVQTKTPKKQRKPRRVKSSSSRSGAEPLKSLSAHKQIDEINSKSSVKGRKKSKKQSKYNMLQEQSNTGVSMETSNNTDELCKPRSVKSDSSRRRTEPLKSCSTYKQIDEVNSRSSVKGRKKSKKKSKYDALKEKSNTGPIMELSNNTDELSPEEDISDMEKSNSTNEPSPDKDTSHVENFDSIDEAFGALRQKPQDCEDLQEPVEEKKTNLNDPLPMGKELEIDMSNIGANPFESFSSFNKLQTQSDIKTGETKIEDELLSKGDSSNQQIRNRLLRRSSTSPLHTLIRKGKSSSWLTKPHLDHGCRSCKILDFKSAGFDHVQCVCRKPHDKNHDCYLQLQFHGNVDKSITHQHPPTTVEEFKNVGGSWKKLVTKCWSS